MNRSWSMRLLMLVLVLATAVSGWLLPTGPLQQAAIITLLLGFPALGWLLVLPGSRRDNLVTAAGFSLLLLVLVTLTAAYIPGAVSREFMLLAGILLALLPYAWPIRLSLKPSQERILWLGWLLLLLLTISFRLVNMDYKEIQGDEGIILTRAAATIMGAESELFLHQKGPVEILIPLAIWSGAAVTYEFWLRLPFFWASLFSVLAMGLLGWRWFDQRIGLIAALFFALGGLSIAFGRIIQYQSFVLLWSLLALLHATLYARHGRGRDLVWSTVFIGGGLLAHYDTILFAPAVLWLLGSRVWQQKRLAWKWWGLAAGLGLGILCLFYLPFLTNPNFSRTFNYLLLGRVGVDQSTSFLSWSGPEVWQMLTFYNSTYTIIGLLGLALIGLIWCLRHCQRATAVAVCLLTFIPLIFYTFIVSDPRTHVYTLYPGLVLLAGAGTIALWHWLQAHSQNRVVHITAVLLFLSLLLLTGIYSFWLFVDNTPERQRTWANNRPEYFFTTWAEPPLFGLFGFPYQAGWHTAATLTLPLPYASNEEQEITDFYMRQQLRTHCRDANTFILAENVQDAVPYDADFLDSLFLAYEIETNGRSTMKIYTRDEPTAPNTIDSRDNIWLSPAEVAPSLPTIEFPLNTPLGSQFVLLGYDIEDERAHPGGELLVRLYWQALSPILNNYQVFTHLFDGEMRGQDDSAPECAIMPTTRWEPGQIIVDPHLIPLNEDTPLGPLPLSVGMYDLLSGERIPIEGTADDAIYLRDIDVFDER